jgi:hypothetical protein
MLRGNSPRVLQRSTWKRACRGAALSRPPIAEACWRRDRRPSSILPQSRSLASRSQRAARHDVLGPDRVRRSVEVDEVSGSDVNGAGAEAGHAGIKSIKIDQTLERVPELARIVKAGRLDRAGGLQPRHDRARGEESVRAARQRKSGAHLVHDIARDIAFGHAEACIPKVWPKSARRRLRSELAQPADP